MNNLKVMVFSKEGENVAFLSGEDSNEKTPGSRKKTFRKDCMKVQERSWGHLPPQRGCGKRHEGRESRKTVQPGFE